MPFSEKMLRAVKCTGERYEVADAHGLSIRVSPLGLITFQYRFRFGGKYHRFDLGNYPLTSLAEAREAHFKARKLLNQGINPIEAKKQAIKEESEEETVAQLVEDFVLRKLRRDRKSPKQAEQILNANVLPFLGQLKVKDVRRRDIVTAIERVVDRGANTMANRTTSLVKQMFKFAVIKGLIGANPCGELTRTSIGGAEKPRDCYLTYRQIWTLWHALEKGNFSESIKLGLKILLATGQRRGEFMRGEWKHVDFERQLWIIPAELSKNGKPHVVHLAPLTSDLFHELKTYSGDSAFFIPSLYGEKDQPMGTYAMNTAVYRYRAKIGLPDLSPHVLRHTVSTQMSAIGIAPHVVEKLLNHSLTGMLAVYNHHQYYAERAAAFYRWASKLSEIVAADSLDAVPNEPTELEPYVMNEVTSAVTS